ncbi:MAG: hypothetical protein RSF94_03515 [Rikenellaceae bacterium]
MQNGKLLKKFIESRYELADYPTLIYQSEIWSKTQPLKGLRILDGTPVFANTLAKYIPLIDAGAEITIGISHIMPNDDDVVSFLRSCGFEVVQPDCGREFDLVLDCAGAFAGVIAKIGYVELTRSGVEVYKNCSKPVFLADSSKIKLIETSLGTGDGYFRAMAQLGYNVWDGRLLVIFGNGKVGQGIASYGRKMGAEVIVFDENSLEADVRKAIAKAYAIVTATGVKDAVSSYATDIMTSKAIIANMGVEDEFGDKMPCERVLENKKPLNFILQEPTHMRYIETTMALHNLGALELLNNTSHIGLIEPKRELEDELLNIVKRNGKIGDELF